MKNDKRDRKNGNNKNREKALTDSFKMVLSVHAQFNRSLSASPLNLKTDLSVSRDRSFKFVNGVAVSRRSGFHNP